MAAGDKYWHHHYNFLIQATQNRNTAALQLKLDELIIATKNARNSLAGIEEAADDEIEAAKREIKARADRQIRKDGRGTN